MIGENAALLEVAGPPAVDAYGDRGSASGGVVWRGRVACHLRRRRLQQAGSTGGAYGARIGSEGSTLVEFDELVVRTARGAPAGILNQPGDDAHAQTILVEDRRVHPFVQRRFRVRSVALRAGGTIADSIRLVLADGDEGD